MIRMYILGWIIWAFSIGLKDGTSRFWAHVNNKLVTRLAKKLSKQTPEKPVSAIIAALIAALGPILIQVITQWLSGLLNKVAPTVPETGDKAADSVALVQAAHDATPRTHIFKRAFLRRLKDHAPALVSGAPLSDSDELELMTLAHVAKND